MRENCFFQKDMDIIYSVVFTVMNYPNREEANACRVFNQIYIDLFSQRLRKTRAHSVTFIISIALVFSDWGLKKKKKKSKLSFLPDSKNLAISKGKEVDK